MFLCLLALASAARILISESADGFAGTVTEMAHSDIWCVVCPSVLVSCVQVRGILQVSANLGVSAILKSGVLKAEWKLGGAGAGGGFVTSRSQSARQSPGVFYLWLVSSLRGESPTPA